METTIVVPDALCLTIRNRLRHRQYGFVKEHYNLDTDIVEFTQKASVTNVKPNEQKQAPQGVLLQLQMASTFANRTFVDLFMFELSDFLTRPLRVQTLSRQAT